jgi:spermidine synthase
MLHKVNNKLIFLLIIIIIVSIISGTHIESYIDYEDNDVILIDRTKSDYQSIELVRNNEEDYCLMLNKQIQNHTGGFNKTHYTMVDVSIQIARASVSSILILGGGDGYPAMRALKYTDNVTNVEIDDKLVNFVKTNNIMIKNTENALNNPNLKIITEDAYKFIKNNKNKYDIIIHDIELGTKQLSKNIEKKDYYIFDKLLSSEGVLNYTEDLDDNPEFKPLFKYYIKLRKKIKAPYFIVYISKKEDFDMLEEYDIILFDLKKTKKKYPKAEIGFIFYKTDISCGDIYYGNEMYIYICKNGFNQENNIEFKHIDLEYIYDEYD